jgi:hypothetical protein
MNYYDITCDLASPNGCLCTKPFDAESARNADIDAPCCQADPE